MALQLRRRDVPFRDAHEIVGRCVAFAIDKGVPLNELSLAELRAFSAVIDASVFDVLTLAGSVNARNHFGGTAPAQVRAAIVRARARL